MNSGNLDINAGEGKILQIGNSFILNSGNLNLLTTAEKGIDVEDSIIFNSGTLNLKTNGEKGIEVGNSIYVKSGSFNIVSSNGKGLQAKNKIYFGVKDDRNENLVININSFSKGIEAKGMEIYSGIINIESKSDSIKIGNNSCMDEKCSNETTSYLKIYGGNIFINSDENGIDSNGYIHIAGGKLILFGAYEGNYQPITQIDQLKITNGTVFAGGIIGEGGIIANTTQIYSFYNYNVKNNSIIQVYSEGNLILNIISPKDIKYFYINNPSNFTVKINGNEIESYNERIRTLISSELETDDYYSKNTQNKIKESIIDENSESLSTFPKQNKQNEGVGLIIEDIFTTPKSKKEENLNEKKILTNIDQNKEKESSEIQEKNIENESIINEKSQNTQNQIEQNNIIASSIPYENDESAKDIDIVENQKELNVSSIKDSEMSNDYNSKGHLENYKKTEDNEESYNLTHFIASSKLIVVLIIELILMLNKY
jgi:hypothetical protein